MKLIPLEEVYKILDNLQERESLHPEPMATLVSLWIKSSKFAISVIPTIDPIQIIDEMINERFFTTETRTRMETEIEQWILLELKSRLLNNK